MTAQRPEAAPAFWHGAKCTSVRVSHFVSGAREIVVRVRSPLGSTAIYESGRRQGSPPVSLQAYVLALAAKARTKGATAAMRARLPDVARVQAEVDARLPAAEAKAAEVARRRAAARERKQQEANRRAVLAAVRKHASLVEEAEVIEAWNLGIVEDVHSL